MFCRLQTHGMVECREKEVCGVLCSQERALQRVCRFPITMQVVRADLVDLDWFWQLIRSVLDWMFKNLRNREVSPAFVEKGGLRDWRKNLPFSLFKL